MRNLGLKDMKNIREMNIEVSTRHKLLTEKLKELLDCMPGSDGSLPLKEIQKRAEEEKEREATLAAMKRKHRKSLTRPSSGPLLPKIVAGEGEDTDHSQPGTSFRSSRGRSRFSTDLDDEYIPPRVLTLKINRPETVPGRFTKTRISDDLTNRAKTENAEDKETAVHQNDKDMDESNGVTAGKSRDEENTQDDEEQFLFASNSAQIQVKFKSVSVSDRGLRVVPIHLIKHQTAPLITEEMIQEQKILRQKYLSKKECHCYRDFIAQENVPGLGPDKPRVNISAEMRRQIRKHTSSIVGRDTFALPVELTREFHVVKLQTERQMKRKDGEKSTKRVKCAP